MALPGRQGHSRTAGGSSDSSVHFLTGCAAVPGCRTKIFRTGLSLQRGGVGDGSCTLRGGFLQGGGLKSRMRAFFRHTWVAFL